jgi:hypothetical protein
MSNPILPVDKKTQDSLNFMPYQAFLNTEYWHELRKIYYEHNPRKCFVCRSKSNLHLHHFNYDSRGKESFNDIVCLCKSCHFALHGNQRDSHGFVFTGIENLQDLKDKISIAEHARSMLDNKTYMMLLPFAKEGFCTVNQAREFWDIPKTKTIKLLQQSADLQIVTLRPSLKIKPESFFINRFIWHLIEFNFPKIN